MIDTLKQESLAALNIDSDLSEVPLPAIPPSQPYPTPSDGLRNPTNEANQKFKESFNAQRKVNQIPEAALIFEDHPGCKDITGYEAETELKGTSKTYILRPSVKYPNCIALSYTDEQSKVTHIAVSREDGTMVHDPVTPNWTFTTFMATAF